jgi:hypothetical protein
MDLDSRGMSHLNNWAGVVWVFDDDINLALTQQTFQSGQKLNFFVENVIAIVGGWPDEQINIPAPFSVIRPRPEQHNLSVFTEYLCGGGANGVDLLLG